MVRYIKYYLSHLFDFKGQDNRIRYVWMKGITITLMAFFLVIYFIWVMRKEGSSEITEAVSTTDITFTVLLFAITVFYLLMSLSSEVRRFNTRNKNPKPYIVALSGYIVLGLALILLMAAVDQLWVMKSVVLFLFIGLNFFVNGNSHPTEQEYIDEGRRKDYI